MALGEISIVSVPVRDQAAAKAFYIDKLGFELVRENPMGPDAQWIELRPSSSGPSITLVTWFDGLKPGGQQGLVVLSDDIESDCASLKARGVDMGEIQDQPYGRFAVFRDLDGNSWVLQGLPTA